ncbi:hypothetical protein ACIBEJ_12480 [Nonomuraea sp. NPDC050790]|uniref:hypothetical protein n=1 Tax=Nonomuraea sp. NPDC050790 TaxID=3364371 RepID=UPI0037BB6841
MPRTTRLIALSALAAAGLLLATAPAHAVIDPAATLICLTESAVDVTALVDPASPGVPAEVPAVGCLQP